MQILLKRKKYIAIKKTNLPLIGQFQTSNFCKKLKDGGKYSSQEWKGYISQVKIFFCTFMCCRKRYYPFLKKRKKVRPIFTLTQILIWKVEIWNHIILFHDNSVIQSKDPSLLDSLGCWGLKLGLLWGQCSFVTLSSEDWYFMCLLLDKTTNMEAAGKRNTLYFFGDHSINVRIWGPNICDIPSCSPQVIPTTNVTVSNRKLLKEQIFPYREEK